MDKSICRTTAAALRFKHFSRKGYAVFNSLSREVSIGRLIISAAMLVGATTAVGNTPAELHAVSATEATIDIDELEVTATQAEVASTAMRLITTITQKEIARIPAQTINELLEQLPGIDIRSRGTNGVQADISMRGGTFDQVLVLLNGVNLTDPQTGHHNLNLPIDPSAIQRIELLQGTTMNQFSLSAFSGAINIITSTNTAPDEHAYVIHANLAAGAHGLLHPALTARIYRPKWQVTASASYNQSTGYMANTDYSTTNAFAHAMYADSLVGKWSMQLGLQNKDFGANSYYSLKYPNQFEATKTLFASVGWEKQIKQFTLDASAYYRTHYDRFELIRAMQDAPAWYVGHNYHLTHTAGANVRAHYASRVGRTSVGVEVRNELIHSNVLGDELNRPIDIPFAAPDSLHYTHGKNRLNVNYFASQSFIFGQWAASLGVAGNYNPDFNANYTFGANVGYHFGAKGKVYANVNRALRLPTFTDLYYKSATQIANPALQPEKAYTFELGAQYAHKGFEGRINAFYRIGQDLIDWVKMPQDDQWRSVNHTRVDGMGGEVSVSYTHGYWLKRVAATYSFVHLDKQASVEGLMSKYALDYMRHKLTLQLDHGIYRGFGATWQFNLQQREGTYIDIADQQQSYDLVPLLDVRVYWQNEKQNIQVYAEGSNLLNKHYYDYGGIAQPGVWVKVGTKLRLGRDA